MQAALRTFPYRSLGLAIAVGTTGGAVFSFWNLPLAWMLGAMTFCLIAAQLRLPISTPSKFRYPMVAVIGVMLGSAFTPEVLYAIPGWTGPILGATAFVVTAGFLGTLFFHKVMRYDSKTALFCGMPGGLMEMLLLADHYGADVRRIALAHSGRVFFTVMTLPFVIEFLTGTGIGATPASGATIRDTSVTDGIWFVGTAVGGVLLGKLVRLPSCYLLGPMLLSMIVHGAGWTDFKPPSELVIVAQIGLGTSVGCRFVGMTTREISQIFLVSSAFVFFMLALALLFAYGVSFATGHSTVSLLLAYAPAGVAEMGLIALTLGIEVTLVTSHHIFRIVLVTIGAGIISRLRWPDFDRGG